jgi:serine phosphatase RsbU (regulator of sigma subunit)/tetratricopeptide (TPR) repeat protein
VNKAIKNIILFFLSGLVFVPMHSQVASKDEPGILNRDSLTVMNQLAEAKTYFDKDSLDEAFELATEALQVAMRSNLEKPEIYALSLIADIYIKEEKWGDAIPYYLRITNILESGQDSLHMIPYYVLIGRCYEQEKVYQKAGEYYLIALRMTTADKTEEQIERTELAAFALFREKQYDSAAFYFIRLNNLLEKTGRDNTQALNFLVQTRNKTRDYPGALKYNQLLFENFQSAHNYREMSVVKNNMAYNLTKLGDYENALLAYQDAIEFGKKASIPDATLAGLYSNTAVCCQNMNNSDQAMTWFRNALSHLQAPEHAGERSRIENLVALIYFHEGDLYNAGLFSRNSIESAREAGDPDRLSECYLTYSRIVRAGNDPVRALEYYEKYLAIRDSLQMEKRLEEQELAQKRYLLEKSEKDLKLKLKEEEVKELAIQQLTLQLEKEEQDKELLRRENDLQLLEQERLRQSLIITRQQHEVEKQERENQILEQEKRISDLRLEQEERKQKEQEQEIIMLEQQKQLDQLELSRQKATKKALILIIVLVILVALVTLGSLITTRRKNQLLARQKKEIEEKNTDLEQKNEEIIAQRDEIEAQRNLLFDQKNEIEQYNLEIRESIEYARRIQSSILPDLDALNTIITDHFIFFRPRDVVSGDFYWISQVEDSMVITVSDCTGHGVPGAFMSMLGTSLLKEIVQKEYITHPGVILRRLRKEIISALGQKGVTGEQRDGMDMALISINQQTRVLEYAGAFNSLYLVRPKEMAGPGIANLILFETDEKFDHNLFEICADKMPIAHYDKMDKFTTHEFKLLKGDNIYLFTDGYADQFGGPKGKKFKYKPFKRMLLENAKLPMEQQHKILSETLDEWMGAIAQVDDICVMGLRV